LQKERLSWRSRWCGCDIAAMNEAGRLTILEERYAHLQRHVTQQDKAMLELTEEVARLRKEIAALRVQQASSETPDDAEDERPPHY